MEEGNTVAERLNGSSQLMDVNVLKNNQHSDIQNSHSENGLEESCSTTASCSSANSSPAHHLRNGTTDSQFKTPTLPLKKTNLPLRKRLTPEADPDIGTLNSKIDALGLVKGQIEGQTEDGKIDQDPSTSNSESKIEKMEEFETSKNPSTICPNSKKCFAGRYPKLPLKSLCDPTQDLFEEMIVDEFSLILFNNLDDYKLFKVHDDEVRKREYVEEEQKRVAAVAQAVADETTRLVKLKKKGRKSKAEIERAQKILRKQVRRETREKRRQRKERHKLRKERGEIPIKQESQEQRELKEQRMKERMERRRIKKELKEQEKEKRKLEKMEKKPKKSKTLSTSQTVSTTPYHQQLLGGSVIGIADLAQQQRRFEQLYHMRKPITPGDGMDELIAATALVYATNPEESDAARAMMIATKGIHQKTPNALGQDSISQAGTSNSIQGRRESNENREGHPGSSRPDSGQSAQKRPASIKRPLSVLDPQQLNGPNSKMLKLEEETFRQNLLAMQASQQGSRRNSLQNQALQPRLNYPPFGMQPMLNGVLPSNTDPNFRFAVPQHLIPMGVQRAAQQPGFDQNQLNQLAGMQLGGLSLAGILPGGLMPSQLNQMMQLNPDLSAALAVSRSPAISSTQQQTSIPTSNQQVSSAGQNRPFTNAPNMTNNPQLNPFANNPAFAATLNQALNAMHAVDPTLLNSHLFGMGGQNMQNVQNVQTQQQMAANGIINQLNEAQKQLEQLSRQPQRTPLGIQQQFAQHQNSSSPSTAQKQKAFMQQQIRTAQIPISNINIPPKLQPENKKTPKQTTPRLSQNPSASHSQISTPGDNQMPSSAISVLKNQNPIGSLPVAVVGPLNPQTSVQATVPLSRPITPSFASSIGIQFPPGTALASQLAGVAKLSGKATFATRTAGDRLNRIHVDVAETLQKLFADNPEMDDGSREGQTCAQFPREWRVPANSQALHLQPSSNDTANMNNPIIINTSAMSVKTEMPKQETSSDSLQQENRGRRSRSPIDRLEKQQIAQPSSLPQTSSNIQDLARMASNQMSQPQMSQPQMSQPQMRAPTVVSQQQADEQRTNLLLQQAQQLGLQTSGIPNIQNISNIAQSQNSAEALMLRHQLLNANAQDAQKIALQQQIMASHPTASSSQRPSITGGFPYPQRVPSSSARTPVPQPTSQSSSNTATQLAGAAALHPALSSVGLGQQPPTSIGPDSVKLMNLIYQQQNAQKQAKEEQLRQQNANREMAKKSNASTSLRVKEEEQKQMRQTPRQQMPQPSQNQQSHQQFAQGLAGMSANEINAAMGAQQNMQQGLPAQLLQQLMASQNSQPLAQMQAALANSNGIPAGLLEALALQQQRSGQMQTQQQRPANIQQQMMQQQGASSVLQQRQQMNAQQLASNFPNLQAQIAQSMAQQQPANNIMSMANNARGGQLDPAQMLALQLIQQQANLMDSQASRNATQPSQMQQQQAGQAATDAANMEVIRQLQQGMMLERSMNNPMLQSQQSTNNQQQSILQQLQLAQQQATAIQQLQNQHGIAPINPNQLANLVGNNFLEADLLMRQMTGQQPPPNLQRSAQDRQQKAEQHRQFREQLLAAANSTPNQATSTANPGIPQNLYQFAALQQQQNGQSAAAAHMANLQQQQNLATQLKNSNPASLMGTPQKN